MARIGLKAALFLVSLLRTKNKVQQNLTGIPGRPCEAHRTQLLNF